MAQPRKPGEFGPITARDRAEMSRSNADADWFNGLPIEQRLEFTGKYVAVRDKRVLASSPTYAGLSRKLAATKPYSVYISRVEEPMTVVY